METITLDTLPWYQITFPKLGISFELDGEAFRIGTLSIKWYGIIIAVGLMLALIYCFGHMKEFGLDGDKVSDAVFAGFIGGIVGARLYYVLFNIEQYKSIKDVFNTRNGGLAIFGGIIGALLVGGITAKIKKIRLMPLLDIASMGFLIGQGIGRWGNFFNHECFGTNTTLPWGMSSGCIQNFLAVNGQHIYETTGVTVDPFLPVHPCFFYESAWCLLGFLLLHIFHKKRKYDGEIFMMYLCWYGLERALVEGLRTDSLMIGPVRVSQLLAFLIFAVSLVFLITMRIKISKGTAPVLYVDTDESAKLLKDAEARIREEEQKRLQKKEDRYKKKNPSLSADQKIIADDESNNNDTEEKENGSTD